MAASPDRKSFLLRLSPEVYEELSRLAAQEFRSVNAQIEVMLRESLRQRGRRIAGDGHGPGSAVDSPPSSARPDENPA
jgi:hypothetical protein